MVFSNSCFAHSFNPGIKFRCLAKKVNAENLGRHLAQKLTGFSLSHFCGLFAFHPQFGTAHTDCSSPAKGRSLPASFGKENPEVSVQSLEFKPRRCTSLCHLSFSTKLQSENHSPQSRILTRSALSTFIETSFCVSLRDIFEL